MTSCSSHDLQRCDAAEKEKKKKKVENWADDLSIAIVCHRENHLQYCHCGNRIVTRKDDTLQILLPLLLSLQAGMHTHACCIASCLAGIRGQNSNQIGYEKQFATKNSSHPHMLHHYT
jgi:hypothetical protein